MQTLILFQSLAEALMCYVEMITLASVLYGGILAFLQWVEARASRRWM